MARRKLPEGDDGHTIVRMDVEGMSTGRFRRPHASPPPENDRQVLLPQAPLTGKETGSLVASQLKAALLVVGVFAAAIVAFVGLLLLIWR